MARVLGQSGRYVTHQAVEKRRQITTAAMILIGASCALLGFCAGFSIRVDKFSLASSSVMLVLIVAVVWLGVRFSERKLAELEKQRVNMRKAAVGEAAVGVCLADFPDEFYVINDLTTPFGNLDHVVVGPTGVFIIDTKSWRGVVAADGKGKLLWNGKPTQKREIGGFVGRLMGIKERVKTLSRCDLYFQGVFAFTSARIDANWGTTASVHCLRDDQLFDYIVNGNSRKRLNKSDIDATAQAFLALARMDKGFEQSSANAA